MRQRLFLTADESIVLFLGVSCALFLVVCLRKDECHEAPTGDIDRIQFNSIPF